MSTPRSEVQPIRADAEVVSNGPEHSNGPAAGIRLVLRIPDWPGFEPGQFLMLSPGALDGAQRSDPLLPRPMAVYRTRDGVAGTEVEVLYQVTGRGTALLAEARPADRVRVLGPLGRQAAGEGPSSRAPGRQRFLGFEPVANADVPPHLTVSTQNSHHWCEKSAGATTW